MSQLAPDGRTPLFALSAAVFVERDGEILLLKRAGGEMTGAWYIPGGAVDAGETVEEAARRELFEESGLAPDGPLTCVGVSHMQAYGLESLQVLYACDCAPGDVVLSDEHSAARWMDARDLPRPLLQRRDPRALRVHRPADLVDAGRHPGGDRCVPGMAGPPGWCPFRSGKALRRLTPHT